MFGCYSISCVISFIENYLQILWTSCVPHAIGRHTWLDEKGLTTGKCNHADFPPEDLKKPYLQSGGAAHQALAKVVFDKTFMANLPYLKNFRYIYYFCIG